MLLWLVIHHQVDGMDDAGNISQHSEKHINEQRHGAAVVQEHGNWRKEKCENDLSDLCAS